MNTDPNMMVARCVRCGKPGAFGIGPEGFMHPNCMTPKERDWMKSMDKPVDVHTGPSRAERRRKS